MHQTLSKYTNNKQKILVEYWENKDIGYAYNRKGIYVHYIQNTNIESTEYRENTYTVLVYNIFAYITISRDTSNSKDI